jgi:hypothetical protein
MRSLKTRVQKLEQRWGGEEIPRLLLAVVEEEAKTVVEAWERKYGHIDFQDGLPSFVLIKLAERAAPLPRGPDFNREREIEPGAAKRNRRRKNHPALSRK